VLRNSKFSEKVVSFYVSESAMEIIKAVEWPFVVAVVLCVLLLVARQEVRSLVGRLNELTFRNVNAKFSEIAHDAFLAASDAMEKRAKDGRDIFTDEDFAAAKSLQRLATKFNRGRINGLVFDLADEFHKVRAEAPSDNRTRRCSAVVAKMRIAAFAARHLAKDLSSSERTGKRLALIAFIQADPGSHPEMMDWLADRVSSKEEPFVQYQAMVAMQFACRNVESKWMPAYIRSVEKAKENYDTMPADKRSERREILDWCEASLKSKPFYRPLSIAGSLIGDGVSARRQMV
jgi:hypothetical protein